MGKREAYYTHDTVGLINLYMYTRMLTQICRAVLCWEYTCAYKLRSAWNTVDAIAFVQGSCEYSFHSGSGLIGRMDSNEHICSQLIDVDTCPSVYHRKALALCHDIHLVRAVKRSNYVFEFVAQPGAFPSDSAIIDYCDAFFSILGNVECQELQQLTAPT